VLAVQLGRVDPFGSVWDLQILSECTFPRRFAEELIA